jgi:hypothetical protein
MQPLSTSVLVGIPTPVVMLVAGLKRTSAGFQAKQFENWSVTPIGEG